MKAIALDDEPIALEIIQSFAAQIPDFVLERAFIKVADAKKFLARYPVDLIFLDINMPEINGLDFVSQISQNTMVIFTTAYSEYAVKGFELNAVDYLLKPISFERFQQAIDKANEFAKVMQLNEQHLENSHLLIRADYQLLKIEFASIQLIEALADYLRIKLVGNKSITIRMTMKAMLAKLPPNEFMRVHRSYIIPIRRILSIRNRVIYLDESPGEAGMEIQIGHSYITAVAQRFSI
jgi:two-component system, LytTR family, response regulator